MTPPLGGSRAGSGRKRGSGVFGEPTQPVRVPLSQVDTVVAYLDSQRSPTHAVDPVPLRATTALPLVAFTSRVPAGFPSPAQDYLEDAIDLNAEMVVRGHEASTYVLRVVGFSMVGAGIFDGDRVVVDRALTAQHGDVVVAILNGDLTIKTLGTIDGALALIPENPHFQPIVPKEGDVMEIWGVVTHALRSFRKRR
ncbi:LexA family protein [Dyella psychrodurans]|uniref:UmuDC operon-like protein n=1 Tax=Dyella psychrodurans TaxID=1927960 RepID=A0A370XC94_9GAMM|nr:translesion error-prone DNA polymerase V autoproteolytic subunit [Dyella psychrodurans]RDS85890.1 umuDC operon-like protein [Dyella psychrodurans]